ncbi:hypothetical protein DCO58_02515 [Helicobacter saguini]|nr:phospholipase A [Helicobacter saguini]MWV66581.1 hypothetical protein [Helicobacter saguini]
MAFVNRIFFVFFALCGSFLFGEDSKKSIESNLQDSKQTSKNMKSNNEDSIRLAEITKDSKENIESSLKKDSISLAENKNIESNSQDSIKMIDVQKNSIKSPKNIESKSQNTKDSKDSINHNLQDFQYKNIESSLQNAKDSTNFMHNIDSIKLAQNSKSQDLINPKENIESNPQKDSTNTESNAQDSIKIAQNIESKNPKDSKESIESKNTKDSKTDSKNNIESNPKDSKETTESKNTKDSKTDSKENTESNNQDSIKITQNTESQNTQDSIKTTQNIESKPKKQKKPKKPKQTEPMFPLLNKEKKEELYHDGYLNAQDIPAAPTPLNKLSKLPLEEWRDTYMIYLYNFTPMYQSNYWRNEAKIQISFRVPMVRNIFKSGGILYVALTDTFFFQLFNESASSPVRDNDFQPEILYTYPMNIQFWGGALTEITTGWRHISNGEVGERSRGSDRWTIKAIWQSKHWGVDVESGFPVRHYEENPDIYKYIAGLDLKIYMRYGNHLADITFSNIVRKKAFFRGNLRLSYTYKYSQYVGLYIQYFIGNNDYLYEYNSFGHRIGAGFRFVR